jgi:hypothetical protein
MTRGFSIITQEKERMKAEKEEVEKKYKTAKVDGRVEQVGTACLPNRAALVWPGQDVGLGGRLPVDDLQ